MSISDAFFLTVLLLPLLITVGWIVFPSSPKVRRSVHIFFLSALLLSLTSNPLIQAFMLEGLDERRGNVMAEKAEQTGLVGMNQKEVYQVLGEPDYSWQGRAGSICLGYKQLPGFWMGSHFQVFLHDDAVTSFEPNDD